jgi:hypothetical protein
MAAKGLAVQAAGVLIGGFAADSLAEAGCDVILRDARDLDPVEIAEAA